MASLGNAGIWSGTSKMHDARRTMSGLRNWRRSGAWILALCGVVASAAYLRFNGPDHRFFQALLFWAAALLLFFMIRQDAPTDQNHKRHGVTAALLHLGVTNLAALAGAWIVYERTPDAKAWDEASQKFFFLGGFVGGLIALFRTTGAKSLAQATLTVITDLRRRMSMSGNLGVKALEARQRRTHEDIARLLGEMVDIAFQLPERSSEIDALTLWFRFDRGGCWRIAAGVGVSDDTMQKLQQPILDSETAGAGVVANMAVMGRALLVLADNPSAHPWYQTDPHSTRKTAGFAAVLLRDRDDKPIGALCLTTEAPDAVPSEADAAAYARFLDVLHLWGAAFILPVERYFDLRKGG